MFEVVENSGEKVLNRQKLCSIKQVSSPRPDDSSLESFVRFGLPGTWLESNISQFSLADAERALSGGGGRGRKRR